MSDRRLLVLDASVGVKWFRDELGSDRAREIALEAAEGHVSLIAPEHFGNEVVAVVARTHGASAAPGAWRAISMLPVGLYPLDEDIVAEAARQCEALRCSFYDALAPAVAASVGATLVSADRRAHRDVPGVELI